MRNLKRALSLALASVMVMGLMVVGSGASYVDVSSENNVEAIEVLQAVGVMTGDENGKFNPDATSPATRWPSSCPTCWTTRCPTTLAPPPLPMCPPG